ncbi:hypothetical protein [Roseovarius sp.]|jgi:hypothetical protein|nr:hypothetical protein [Roseovarius sp.]MDM8165952.1 hypothetical protein [Roseovarius sp.]
MYDKETHALLETAREYRAAYIRGLFRSLFRRSAPAYTKPAHAA